VKQDENAKILVIDVGGTNIKVSATGWKEVHKIRSGSGLSAQQMVDSVRKLTRTWVFGAVTVGFPGPVRHNHPLAEPANLGPGWVGFDFRKAFQRPVKVINDAAMQALGSYEGGHMLFLGLGTGLGSAMVVDGVVNAMELAHLPYKRGRTFEDFLGKRGQKRLGRKRWEMHVHSVVEMLAQALTADYVVLGGGEAKKLSALPTHARLGANSNALLGGYRLWDQDWAKGLAQSAEKRPWTN
jgi:polyphosphate glucokinase